MNHYSISETIILKIKELLSSHEFLDSHRMPNHFIRKRMLSMFHIVIYLFFTSKRNMWNNISEIQKQLPPLQFPNISKQALSKARQGILPSLFQTFFDISVDVFCNSSVPLKRWKNKFRIFAVDGSKLCVPNSKSNFARFGEMFSKANPKRRWSGALCSIIYDVCNDYIIHSMIRPFLASERNAALQHCSVMEDLGLFKNAILVFDRGYYSEAMFRYFSDHNFLCVMRLKESVNIAKRCKSDYVTFLHGDLKDGTADIRIRVIPVPLASGETEYLGTNIFDASLSVDDFKDLYFQRWKVESKYGELKNQLMIEEFSGATEISVEQEFFINLLLSNVSSLLKHEADQAIAKKARPANKYRYQANRAFIISNVKEDLPVFYVTCWRFLFLNAIPKTAGQSLKYSKGGTVPATSGPNIRSGNISITVNRSFKEVPYVCRIQMDFFSDQPG